ncbi:MAG TPA: hypothetical protein VN711_00535 [Candidatus Saccharimonadales bacterium]|nr:hypothetical protein [Candidatus Saccharimonadales bacterium]
MEEIESSVSLRMWIGAAVVVILVVVAGVLIFTHSKSTQNSQTGNTQNAVEIIPTATPVLTNTQEVTPTPVAVRSTTTTTQRVYYYYPMVQQQGSQSQNLGNGTSQSQTLGNLTQTQN